MQGRVTRETRADGVTDTVSTYDPATGLLRTVTDPKGQVTTYSYNRDDAVQSIVFSNAQIATPSVSFTYGSTYGRVATMEDGTGTTTYGCHPVGSLGAGQIAGVDGPLGNDTITAVTTCAGAASRTPPQRRLHAPCTSARPALPARAAW